MIVSHTFGNLITNSQQGKYDVIVHGCNCFCTMGAGIAKTIKLVYPEAYEADLQTVRGDRSKLGTYSKADIQYEHNGIEEMLTIVNAYTQYDWRGYKPLDYIAVREAFTKLNEDYKDMNVGIPLIGCGLAGGNWDRVSDIIDRFTPNLDVHVVEFKK